MQRETSRKQVAILIPEKQTLCQREYNRQKKSLYSNKEINSQVDKSVDIYAPNIKEHKYIKQMLTDQKREMDTIK